MVDGLRMHHLQADVTPLSLAGAAPPLAATPPADISLAPTTEDIWMRSGDGSVARMTENVDLTSDLSALRSAKYPDAMGRVHSVITSDVSLSPSNYHVEGVTASLAYNPIPAGLPTAFGPFGVQSDGCPLAAPPSPAAVTDVNAPPICGTVAQPGMPPSTVKYVDALHEISAKQAQISANLVGEDLKPSLLDMRNQISADTILVGKVGRISFTGTVRTDAATFINAVDAYDALLRDALAIQTPTWFSGYNKYSSSLRAAMTLRRAVGNQVRSDLGFAPSTCSFYYP
jgi:hypothetical protein